MRDGYRRSVDQVREMILRNGSLTDARGQNDLMDDDCNPHLRAGAYDTACEELEEEGVLALSVPIYGNNPRYRLVGTPEEIERLRLAAVDLVEQGRRENEALARKLRQKGSSSMRDALIDHHSMRTPWLDPDVTPPPHDQKFLAWGTCDGVRDPTYILCHRDYDDWCTTYDSRSVDIIAWKPLPHPPNALR